MAASFAYDIPLKVLICDAVHGAAATLEQAIRQADAVLTVKSVNTLKRATAALGEDHFNTIFIDPLSFNLDDASVFIFSMRKSLPEIVFVLYVDKSATEQRRADFYKGERRRFAHYYQLDKRTPISSFGEELLVVLNSCRQYLSFGMSAASLERLKKEAAGLAKSTTAEDLRRLVEQAQAVLAQLTPAVQKKQSLNDIKKVFLSHRFAEKEYVEGLALLLQQSGFEVVTGRAVDAYIGKAVIERIRESDYFLCLMTQGARKDDGTYTTSPWLLEEKGVTLALEKPIVLMVEEGVTDIGGLQGDWQRLHFGNKGFLTAALEAVKQLKSYSGQSAA